MSNRIEIIRAQVRAAAFLIPLATLCGALFLLGDVRETVVAYVMGAGTMAGVFYFKKAEEPEGEFLPGPDFGMVPDKIAQGKINDYLDLILKNEMFKVVLKERLADCLTREEVDERLPVEKVYIQKIVDQSKS